MKSYINLLLVGFIFTSIFFSCNSVYKEKVGVNFKHTLSLEGEEILKNSIGISSIHTVNNYLITKNSGKDYFFTVYSLDSLKELGSIVAKGGGPNEFPSSARFDYTMSTGNYDYLWAHDLNYPVLLKVNLEKSLEKGETIVEEEIKLPFEEGFVTAFKISDDKIIGRSGNTIPSMGRLKVYNPKTKHVSLEVPFFPQVKTSRTDYDFVVNKLNFIYVGSLTLKPDGRRIASALNSFNQIDVFNDEGEVVFSIKDDSREGNKRIQEYLDRDKLDWTHLMTYYGGICSTYDFIFALFRNQINSDYGEKMIPTTIRVFDWEGNSIAELKVPDYLFSIAIDEKNGYLIGFSYYEEKVMRYNIQNLLEGKL